MNKISIFYPLFLSKLKQTQLSKKAIQLVKTSKLRQQIEIQVHPAPLLNLPIKLNMIFFH